MNSKNKEIIPKKKAIAIIIGFVLTVAVFAAGGVIFLMSDFSNPVVFEMAERPERLPPQAPQRVMPGGVAAAPVVMEHVYDYSAYEEVEDTFVEYHEEESEPEPVETELPNLDGSGAAVMFMFFDIINGNFRGTPPSMLKLTRNNYRLLDELEIHGLLGGSPVYSFSLSQDDWSESTETEGLWLTQANLHRTFHDGSQEEWSFSFEIMVEAPTDYYIRNIYFSLV